MSELNKNVNLVENNNEIVVSYVPDNQDLETNFYEGNELEKISYRAKKTSIFNFLYN